jgi:hypothetical protein
MDTFDVPLGDAYHETFTRGVMAPPARVRVGDRLRISREEVMERFHDVIHHTHELIVCGGRMHTLCYEVINGPCSVAQTKRKRCRGVLGKACQGEWFSFGKP